MYDVKVYSLAAEGGRQVTPHFKVRDYPIICVNLLRGVE